ncbi:4Fe-4S dicluster domain-containing protein [Methanogenium marinum]|uniref:4Fe-4S dicluster domain-containing protein n=1 Tax=Methanogenium marinum TaxID=348610 RepID=A0A9Q4KV47_9EURY|nr:4Fe-4S dicluster domain-containing protein [Methanogenium marinum]MDE4907956.1 4Fe-4S dicluster domain-containing protein [Methanogenium marinum]
MKRKIISIDEDKCTGCGECIPDCPEGALQLIDGKARLVSDLFCDGLGACMGTCPVGAITVIEREAEPYDENTVMANIVRQGKGVIIAHLEHLAGHGETELYNQAIEYLIEHGLFIPDHNPAVCSPKPEEGSKSPFATCPGTAAQNIERDTHGTGQRVPSDDAPSELRQWPVQLTLLNASNPYFDNADLLISADCVPFAYAGFHTEFLQNRILIIFCPKLDSDIDGYVTKLADIFSLHTIKSITIARMEVPCCGGVRYVVDRALEKSGKTIPVMEKTITIKGTVE